MSSAGSNRARIAHGRFLPWIGRLGLGLLGVLALLAVDRPPAVVPTTAPADVFSAARAFQHIEVIAQHPHPLGTVEHDRVRDYLVAQLRELGLTPEVQTATSSIAVSDGFFRAATVQNILARRHGTVPGPAMVLIAHYDSVPTGPGAADDAAGVAAILEVLRALRDAPPLQRDVIVLFTDGEEDGLLGSRVFVSEHPWAADIGLVFNFESRGAGGASLMFQTSVGNRRLIGEFADAVPRAAATSLMGDLYRQLPNDTDLTPFMNAGLPGLNFAFGGRAPAYHTALDTAANLDRRSLQQHGDYALALARHFGNLDLALTTKADAIYFTVFGRVIHYGRSLALLTTVLLTLVLGILLVIGIRGRRLAPTHILYSLLALVITALATGGIVTGLGRVVELLWGGRMQTPEEFTYDSHLYALSFVVLSVAVTVAVLSWLSRRISLANYLCGGLLAWLALLVITTMLLPGATYLFAWPLLGGLLVLALLLRVEHPENDRWLVMAGLLPATVGVLLLVPIVYLLYEFFPLSLYGAISGTIPFLLWLLAPYVVAARLPRSRWLLGVAGIVSLGLLFTAWQGTPFSPNQPRANNIFYSLNADTGNAIWASFDTVPDPWTEQFLGVEPEQGNFGEVVLVPSDSSILKNAAPAVAVATAEIIVLDDSEAGDERTVRLRVIPPADAIRVAVAAADGTEVLDVTLEGKALEYRPDMGPWFLWYYNMPDGGVELTLKVSASTPLNIATTVVFDNLPNIPGISFRPRPNNMMPLLALDNQTVVSQTYSIGPTVSKDGSKTYTTNNR